MKTPAQIPQNPGCNLKFVLRKLSLLMVSALLLGPVLGRAAVYTYTSTVGGSVTTDGTGFWRTTAGTNHWRLNNAGTAGPWVNNNDAIIGNGGTPGTITLQSTPVVNNVTFNSVASGNYIITASSLRIGSAANQVVTFTLGSGVSADIGNNGGSSTYLQQGGGNNGIIFSGGGTMLLTYTGTTTPYTGSMTVSNGTAVFVGAGFLSAGNTNNLTSGTLGSFNSTARAFTKPTTLRGDFTLGAPSPRNGNLAFDTGAWMLFGGSYTLTVNTITVTNNSVIGQDGSSRGLAFSSLNSGKLILNNTETYTGDTKINSGTLALGASGVLNAASGVNIAAGAKFDVSALTTWTLGSSASLKASGTSTNAATASTIGGGTTVDAGTRPILLNFTPTAFTGDTTHPSLFLETGSLSLGGNAFTVTNASGTALGAGTYRLIEQAAGSVSSSGSHSVIVAGSGVTGGSTASISVSGGFVNLLVSSAAAATQIQPETAADGTGSLVSAQTVNSGNSITVYAIARAADNSFVSNSTAVWSLQNVTGGVVSGDLIPSGDTKSAVFTGAASGTANIRSTSGALTATDSGTITVTCGTATVSNPADQTVATGGAANFTVSAGSSSLPTYQWQSNSVNIVNATNASYTTPAATAAMNGAQYRCLVSVACDSSSATSAAATLTVVDPSSTSFRSTASGLWSSTSTWQISLNNGASWITAIAAPSDANSTNITVQAAHTVTSSGTAFADDLMVAGQVTISGGTFTIANGAATIDCDVTGTIEQTGGTLTTTGALTFESGATFKWNANAAPAIPSATWADGSTCVIQNTLSSGASAATGLGGQSFYDFRISYPSVGQRMTFLAASTAATIRRDLTVTIPDTASASIVLMRSGSILTVGRNFLVTNGLTASTTKLLIAGAAADVTLLKLGGNLTCTNADIDGFGSALNTIEFNGSGGQVVALSSVGTFAAATPVFQSSTTVSYQVNPGTDVRIANGRNGGALTLNGTLQLDLGITFAGTNIIGSAGVFKINFNGGTVPTAVWPASSRVEVLAATSTSPTAASMSQPLYDFTWDSPGQTGSIGMGGPTITNNGTFLIKNTGGNEVRFSSSQSQVIVVNHVRVQGGTLVLSSAAGAPTLNVGGDLTVDSGATLKGAGGVGMGAINLTGNLTNNGTLNLALNRTNTPTATKLTGVTTVNQNGTLTIANNGPAPQNGDTFDLFDGTITGSFSTVNLPTGGAAHWNISDLNIGGTVTFTNANPAASNFSLGVAVGGSATVSAIGKYAATPDADGDAVTITAVSTPSSGTATIIGGTNITYTSTGGPGSDSFTYTVSDGFGGTDTKTVSVAISSPEGFNKLSGPTGAGPYSFSYLGIPGLNYALDESPNLVAPYTWFPVITNTASGVGAIDYIGVPLSYPSGSFRTRYVP